MGKQNLYDWTFEEMGRRVEERGQPSYRAKQIFEWLYQKDVSDIRRMTNLPANWREAVAHEWPA